MLISRPAIVALTTALAFGATPVLAAQRPSLRIVRSWPLSLHATGFRAGESVRVTVRMGSGHWSRYARTDAAGAFSTRFAGLRLRSCARPLNITAQGAHGDYARALIPPRDCAPD